MRLTEQHVVAVSDKSMSASRNVPMLEWSIWARPGSVAGGVAFNAGHDDFLSADVDGHVKAAQARVCVCVVTVKHSFTRLARSIRSSFSRYR